MSINQKLLTIVWLVAITSSLSIAVTDAAAAERKGRPDQHNIDTDKDGAVSLDEALVAAAERSEQKFTKLDVDQDGLVSFEEFTASPRGARDLSSYADEIVQCVSDLKEELGSETIQVPSADQFKSPQEKFDIFDTNLDGVIELSEALDKATAKATEKFELQDADADGYVTKEEKKAHLQAHKGTRYAIKTCIDEITADSDIL